MCASDRPNCLRKWQVVVEGVRAAVAAYIYNHALFSRQGGLRNAQCGPEPGPGTRRLTEKGFIKSLFIIIITYADYPTTKTQQYLCLKNEKGKPCI